MILKTYMSHHVAANRGQSQDTVIYSLVWASHAGAVGPFTLLWKGQKSYQICLLVEWSKIKVVSFFMKDSSK